MPDEMMEKYGTIGVIGLGNMGMPICANLVKAGCTVTGCARTTAKLERLRQNGGIPAASTSEVGKNCRYIITSLPSKSALDTVVEALRDSCAPGTIVIETSTMSLDGKLQARERLEEKGIIMLDAPLSGTGAQAITKDVVVYASGDQSAVERCMPLFDGFARLSYYLGAFGNGTKMKLIANQLVAIHNVAAAEAVLFGVKSGLDANQVIEVIGSGAGGSRMLSVRGPLMARRAFQEATCSHRVFQKDLCLIADALRESGTPSPLFHAAIPVYTAAVASGYGEEDTASVYAVLEKMSAPETTR